MNHLAWGLQISALGMGLVFALLALLWGLLTLVLRLDGSPMQLAPSDENRADSEPTDEAPGATGTAAAAQAPEDEPDAALLAAVALAVARHRAALRQQAAPGARTHGPGSLLHMSRWVAAGRVRQNQSWSRKGGR